MLESLIDRSCGRRTGELFAVVGTDPSAVRTEGVLLPGVIEKVGVGAWVGCLLVFLRPIQREKLEGRTVAAAAFSSFSRELRCFFTIPMRRMTQVASSRGMP